MTKFNVTQAAKQVGVSRRTLQRHIQQGKVSCSENQKGEKYIDASELMRAYGELQPVDAGNAQRQSKSVPQTDAPDVTPILESKINLLETRVEELVKERDREREEHHRREEKWDTEREKFWQELATKNLLLEDLRNHRKEEKQTQEEVEPEPKSSDRWLVWALGGLTFVIGTVAVAAIYYLLQQGA